jgi:hypothetical protein
MTDPIWAVWWPKTGDAGQKSRFFCKKDCKFTRMGDTAFAGQGRKFIPAAVTVHKDRSETSQ